MQGKRTELMKISTTETKIQKKNAEGGRENDIGLIGKLAKEANSTPRMAFK